MVEGKDIQLEIDSDEESKEAMTNMVRSAMNVGNIKNYGRWALYAIKAEISINELRGCLY